MFNESENKKLLHATGVGAAAGAIIDVILFVWSLLGGVWNCLCDCFGGGGNWPLAEKFSTYLFVFLICLGIGILIGFFQAMTDRSSRRNKEKAAQSKAAREKRELNASNINKIIVSTMRHIKKQQDAAENEILELEDEFVINERACLIALSNVYNENEEVKLVIERISKEKEEQ